MGKTPTTKDLIKEAANARSDLNIFYAVIALMESSLVSSDCHATESCIVKICQGATQRCLKRYDKATDQILARTAPPASMREK